MYKQQSATALSTDELVRMAPAIFAESAHESRSERYTYIPTLDVVNGMRSEGFMPVQAFTSRTRTVGKAGFNKHLLRFRRADQMDSTEAREVILINSHDGSSGFKIMAGVYRFVCSNGLICGETDNEIRVRHSGDAVNKVIEGAYSIVNDFDRVAESISGMKSLTLNRDHANAFAKAALAIRFESPEDSGFDASQLLRPRRQEDTKPDLFSVFNVVQENAIKGGLHGRKVNELGQRRNVSTKSISGIDQNTAINRGLWTLAEEMRKLMA